MDKTNKELDEVYELTVVVGDMELIFNPLEDTGVVFETVGTKILTLPQLIYIIKTRKSFEQISKIDTEAETHLFSPGQSYSFHIRKIGDIKHSELKKVNKK